MTDQRAIPVILDTDIGSDIDDALCLAYLLRQPRCELLGVTTVTGKPRERAMLVDLVCRAAGRSDVPIHSGSGCSLLMPQLQPEVPQAEVLAHLAHREDFEPNTAVEFLRRAIRDRPGEITLLSIGPLTNIGLLFAIDPEIPGMLKQLVMMCGVFATAAPGGGWREWNAMVDPHATAIAYNAPVKCHTSIGLDVTLRCTMEAGECRGKFTGDVLEMVGGMAEVWFRHAAQLTFHDPLAGAVIFEPEICRYEAGRVEVELQSPRLQGMTLWDPACCDKPHRIAVDVDSGRFFEHYFSVAGK